MNKAELFFVTLASCFLFLQQGFAYNHRSETTHPIIAQYFSTLTERDQLWEEKFRNDTPFTKLNRLYLVAGKIIKSSDHHHWVKFEGSEQRALDVIKRMHEVNPKAEIFLVVRGNEGPNSFGGAAHDEKFPGHVLSFLQQYGFDGLDVNWKEGLDKSKLSDLLTNLSNTLHPAGFKITLDAWQYVSPAYDIPYIKDYIDQMNIMSYGTGISLEVCVGDYIRAGMPSRKIIGSVETESDYHEYGGVTDTLGFDGTIAKKAMFAKDSGLAGMAAWRLDNDYAYKSNMLYPTYRGAVALWDEMNASRNRP